MLHAAEIERLAPKAIVALAARCDRLIQPWLAADATHPLATRVVELDNTLFNVEAFACDAHDNLPMSPVAVCHAGLVASAVHAALYRSKSISEFRRPLYISAQLQAAAARTETAITEVVAWFAKNDAPEWPQEEVRAAIISACDELRALSPSQPDIAVPARFFSMRAVFGSRVPASQLLHSQLLHHFADDISILRTLSPRDFEHFVLKVLAGLGFEVELTSQTCDGGRDIIAVRHDATSVKYLVECKRYSEGNRVGVGVVRQLHGVVDDERATKGILVTTSTFTRGAKTHLERNKWRLEGRDLTGVLDWLNSYQELRMREARKRTAEAP